MKLRAPDWNFDPEELAAAFGPKTKAVILNTPNNPTGKVFNRAELEMIRDLCVRWNCLAITDEIYEYMLYDGAEHISIATLDGMRERTVTINALSKTYGVTGWRVSWAIAPPEVSFAIRKCHDFSPSEPPRRCRMRALWRSNFPRNTIRGSPVTTSRAVNVCSAFSPPPGSVASSRSAPTTS